MEEKSSLRLNEKILEDIQRAMEEYEQGQFINLEEVKRQLGL